jgi:uncharacterized damage-inducible protein DinB
MYLPLVLLAVASAAPAPAHAQDAAMKSIAPLHETVKGYLIASAEQMPEELYSFRPNDEVRTFGQIIGHVANAQYMFCGAATGEGGEAPENFEERTTKAGLVEALKMGFEACDAAYAMDDAKALEEVQFFGNTGTRLWVLSFGLTHNWEHYGNLVVYFRANGMVPPSSQGGGM